MKVFRVSFLLTAVLCMHVSCRKSIGNTASALSGRWNVVVDSFSSNIGPMKHLVVYNGGEGDYYDFRSDGNLYVKEGTTSYAYPYHLTSSSSVTIIVPDPVYDTATVACSIDNLTSHTVTLADRPVFFSPGGGFEKVVHLKR